jgi:hypothetical protein
VFHAVRHHLGKAEEASVPVAEALRVVTNNVIGLDLHPVAVTLAQVTYLLAMGPERLRARTGAAVGPCLLGRVDALGATRGEPVRLPGSTGCLATPIFSGPEAAFCGCSDGTTRH